VIEARIVLEPKPHQGHVRITARSADYELLWGTTASPGMLKRHPVEVAFYQRLIDQAESHIKSETPTEGTAAIERALATVQQLRSCLDTIEKSLTPKKVSDKTEKRADGVAGDLLDALRCLSKWSSTEETE
jgi:hypothetical protein